MSDDPQQLAARYGASMEVVSRGGVAYPAAVLASPSLAFEVDSEPIAVDPELATGGEAHLARVREAVPWMYDGTVLSLVSVSSGVVRAAPSCYFDRIRTGDALRAETGDALRARAESLCGGDPLRSGRGRAAGFGVTVVATVVRDGRRHVVMGRRGGLPIGAGTWHVVPAGMAEPHPSCAADAFRATAVEELSEELGVDVDASSLRLLGLGFDLLRLLPEVIFTVALPDDADRVLLHAPREEHDVLQLHAVDPLGRVPTVWAAHPPHRLAPPGAAALALFEESGA